MMHGDKYGNEGEARLMRSSQLCAWVGYVGSFANGATFGMPSGPGGAKEAGARS